MRWTNALRDIELSEMEIDNNLSCNKCIYCIKKNEKI